MSTIGSQERSLGMCISCSIFRTYLPAYPNSATIHSIISRLGVDMLVNHMTRVREHDWLKSVSPESIVLPCPSKALPNTPSTEQEGEIWFDWSFVDFWKSNQRTMPDFFPNVSLTQWCLPRYYPKGSRYRPRYPDFLIRLVAIQDHFPAVFDSFALQRSEC